MDTHAALSEACEMLVEYGVCVAVDRDNAAKRGDQEWAERCNELWHHVFEVRDALTETRPDAIAGDHHDLNRVRALAADLVYQLGHLVPGTKKPVSRYTEPSQGPARLRLVADRVVAYLRVSTDRQADEGFGLEVQEAAVRSWARKNGVRLSRVITDEISGTTEAIDRPGLAEALGEVQAGRAGGIVVARLDRIARDLILQEWIRADLLELGAELRSASSAEDLFLRNDPEDPTGNLIRQILGAVAEYERAIIRLRMQAGKARKRASGGYTGGPPPYGKRAVDRELVDVREEQTTIERMIAWRGKGMSYRQIAERLNREDVPPQRGDTWYPITVSRIIKRAS